MTIWEDAHQAWMRSERGEYGHNDDRKINAAISRGRKLESALRELMERTVVFFMLVYPPDVWTPDDNPTNPNLGPGEVAVKRLHASVDRARAALGEESKR
jgi:hypothetical protein